MSKAHSSSFARATSVRLLVTFVVATAAFSTTTRAAHACNPYQATFQTSIAPDNPAAGTLYYNIESTCTNHVPPKRPLCGGSIAIPSLTPISDKCADILAAITLNSACSAFTITNNCNSPIPSFTVTDPGCTAQGTSADGLLFGISNQNDVLGQHPENPSALVDYEFDTITPGCAQQGNGDVGVLQHSASGQAISGGQLPNVTASIDLPNGFSVTTQFMTHAGDSPKTILSGLAAQINSQGSGASCVVVGNRALQCSASGNSVPLSLQLNDTALSRMSVSGPPQIVQKLVQLIDSPSAPLVTAASVVNPPTPIVHGTLDLSHPRTYNVNQGEFDTGPFETVDELSLFYSFFLNGALVTLPATFAPGVAGGPSQEGDVVFIEENPALTTAQQLANCQAFIDSDPIAHGTFFDPASGCVLSDIVRFVNVTDPVSGLTQGHIYFLSDGLDPQDFALVPPVAGPRNVILTKVEQFPSPNPLNRVQLVRKVAGTNQRLIITYSSDTGEVANVSDSASVTAVPALSPVAVLAMGALLIGLGIMFVARRRKGGRFFSA